MASTGGHDIPQVVEELRIQGPPSRRAVQVIDVLAIVVVGLLGMQPPSNAQPRTWCKASEDGDLDVVANVANKAVLHVFASLRITKSRLSRVSGWLNTVVCLGADPAVGPSRAARSAAPGSARVARIVNMLAGAV
jgi:hypothetical protein